MHVREDQTDNLLTLLTRIAQALEITAGSAMPTSPENWDTASAWVWNPDPARQALMPVADTGALPLSLLVGINPQIDLLKDNTWQFAQGYLANNALLWGARGMGKSSLVKSIHADIEQKNPGVLKLIEIHREDILSLPTLLSILRQYPTYRFILFCDDLSFDEQDGAYKSLKAVLEGGLDRRPDHVLFYATSNRRHLIPRQMIENERTTAIHPGETVEEKVSLSDRFGLWLGFYPCTQDEYLAMITGYAGQYGLTFDDKSAVEWATTRGARSGRVAWQYIQQIAGQQKIKL
ncbi:MAG: ATP-binding protein [Alphaproteobacteria bacterium]|nr:ATP-binding protein [Alphaproteobacteria bacterium]